MSKLSISFMIVIFLVGIGVGYTMTSNYSMDQYEAVNMPALGQADAFWDLRYLNMMIAHHQSAIVLAKEVKNTSERKEIKSLAEEIIANEPKAIQRLYDYKESWYSDTKKVPASKVPALGEYNDTYDLRFLNALIFHHEEGVRMAREAKLKTARTEIMDDANAVDTFLSGSILMLKGWRTDWYGN